MQIKALYSKCNSNYPAENVYIVGFLPFLEVESDTNFRIVCIKPSGLVFLAKPCEIKVIDASFDDTH